ncbi:MAG TPA: hypothetical protein VKE98_20790, partial [Gemmataceae bacterium]|nr:hypothetical protein [Gemmataceae bacterium]
NLGTATKVPVDAEMLNLWEGHQCFWLWISDRFFVVFPNPLLTEKTFLFDLFTGQRRELKKEESPYALSPDGQTIAVDHTVTPLPQPSWWGGMMEWLGIRQPSSTRFVTLKATSSGEEIATLHGCMYPGFSPSGKTLVVSGSDGSLQLWDLPIRKPVGKILGLAGLAAVATLLAFNGLGWLRWRKCSGQPVDSPANQPSPGTDHDRIEHQAQ